MLIIAQMGMMQYSKDKTYIFHTLILAQFFNNSSKNNKKKAGHAITICKMTKEKKFLLLTSANLTYVPHLVHLHNNRIAHKIPQVRIPCLFYLHNTDFITAVLTPASSAVFSANDLQSPTSCLTHQDKYFKYSSKFPFFIAS